MSKELPALRARRHVVEGQGHVVYTLRPDALATVLKGFGVNSTEGLPESFLRELCRLASNAEIRKQLQRIEEEQPGEAVMTIGTDSAGHDVEMRSAEVGFDIVMGFVPPPDDEIDLRCNPQYSPVNFELRVFDTSPEAPHDPTQNLGHCVLNVTLQPPSLA